MTAALLVQFDMLGHGRAPYRALEAMQHLKQRARVSRFRRQDATAQFGGFRETTHRVRDFEALAPVHPYSSTRPLVDLAPPPEQIRDHCP